MADMEVPQHVAIVGGGLSGLSLALALHKVHIPCTVYEGRDESYEAGGGITLSPNALRILDKLDVFARVRDKGFHFDTLAFSDGDGVIKDLYYFGSEKLYGYRGFRIMRHLLINEMKLMLRENGTQIHFNKQFSKVIRDSQDEVVIEFADGSVETSAIVIGADGIHSTVRNHIVPDVKPVYSGMMAISSVCPRSSLRIPENFYLPAHILSKAGAFLMVPQEIDGSQLLIGSQRRFPEKDKDGWDALAADKQGLLDMLRENQGDWPDIVQSALENAPVENMGIWPFYGIPKFSKWASSTDRVIVLGDAAHAIPPTAGQGVNQAFEDVNMLALLLSNLSQKTPLGEALKFWQQYRQRRIDKILDLTQKMNAKRLPPAEQAKLPPGSVWADDSATTGEGGQLRWLYEPDLDEDVAEWLANRGS
ncbi:kynurenine 3-monooxygenase [Histoplasma ohiense]|nr:kynurenine 3-monooxygenase [Histoplasma ohiense (nom. inval.)]